ncbi:hypothetical protein ETTORE_0157 [Pseudomonas phage Ettore]|nr:hypothetical protein ETTORE_0157 [Pseudomonas phage Ettore]
MCLDLSYLLYTLRRIKYKENNHSLINVISKCISIK